MAQLENVATPFDTKVTIDRLAIDKDQTKKMRDNFGLNDQPPYNEFFNSSDTEDFANLVSDLIDYPAAERKVLEANLNEILHPFNSEESSIFIDEDSNISAFDIEGDYTEVSDIRSSSEYYIVEPIQYEIMKDKN